MTRDLHIKVPNSDIAEELIKQSVNIFNKFTKLQVRYTSMHCTKWSEISGSKKLDIVIEDLNIGTRIKITIEVFYSDYNTGTMSEYEYNGVFTKGYSFYNILVSKHLEVNDNFIVRRCKYVYDFFCLSLMRESIDLDEFCKEYSLRGCNLIHKGGLWDVKNIDKLEKEYLKYRDITKKPYFKLVIDNAYSLLFTLTEKVDPSGIINKIVPNR